MSAEIKPDLGQRNSEYRKISEALLDRPVKVFHNRFPKVSADHVSIAGVLLSIGGIHLMESQHRAQKYNPKTTLLAVGLVGIGMALDLFDGKLARTRRNELKNDEEKLKDEEAGQWKDPVADSVVETFQTLASAYTAHKLGNKFGVQSALFNLATSNVPRTLKAIAGVFKKSVPEAYKFYDPRSFGTSLLRKIPNYSATLFPKIAGVSNLVAGVANLEVARERAVVAIDGFDTIFDPSVKPELSDKEIRFAATRAKYLGLQTLANGGIALIADRLLRS